MLAKLHGLYCTGIYVPSVLSSSALALSPAVGSAAVDPPLVYQQIKKMFFQETLKYEERITPQIHSNLLHQVNLNKGNDDHDSVEISDLDYILAFYNFILLFSPQFYM